MANCFPASGLAYADAFSVGTANSDASSLYVCSACVQAVRIEQTYAQSNLHHNTLWLRQLNCNGTRQGASIGFTVSNTGGDHHRANIEATGNSGQIGGNLALYTRNNSGVDTLGYYQTHDGKIGINNTAPCNKLHVVGADHYQFIVQDSSAVIKLGADDNVMIGIGMNSNGFAESQCDWFIGRHAPGASGIKDAMYISRLGASSWNHLFVLNNDGNVGIGTTSPGGFGSGAPGPFFNVASVGTAESYMVSSACANTCYIGTYGWAVCTSTAGDKRAGFIVSQLEAAANSTTICANIQFFTNAGGGTTERMRISPSGNVGIGTTVACTRLSVRCSTGGVKIDLLSLTTTDGAGSQPTLRFDTIEANCNVLGRISVCDIAPYAGAMIFETSAAKAAGSTTTTEVMRLVGTTGNVGIGTTSPNVKLTVDSITGNTDVAGFFASSMNTSNFTYVKWGKNLSTVNNSAELGFKYIADGCNTNMASIGFYGNGGQFNVLANGNVGVATQSPSYKLHVNGTFYAAGSSIKYKEGICNYDTNSCLFMCLKPVTYQYKDEFKHLGKELKSDIQIGLIAEDVAEVMPELAVLVNEEDEKVVRNVDYEKLSIVLLAEVQKLRREVDTLKNN